MKNARYAILLSAIAITALTFTTGCETVKEGSNKSVSYVRGEYIDAVPAPLSRTVSATRKVISKLKFKKYSDQADAISAKFVVSNAKEQDITIILESAGADSTTVKIQIDAFGDKDLSQTLVAAIKKAL